MSRRLRRNHSAAFKTKVALDAVGDGKTIAEIAHKHDVHPHQVSEWRRQLLSRAAEVFGGPAATAEPRSLSGLGIVGCETASAVHFLPAFVP